MLFFPVMDRDRESFSSPGKVMGHTVYLHQQGISGRNGLLVSCTIGNNCVVSASDLPGAVGCVFVCMHVCVCVWGQQRGVQLAVMLARTGGAVIMPKEKLPSASLAAL